VVDDKIADMLLDDLLEEGGSITVAVDEGELVFS
jgi:ATP-dependent Clp protease ATP-binding subunit ClpC